MGTTTSDLLDNKLDPSRIKEIAELISESFVSDFKSAVQDYAARSIEIPAEIAHTGYTRDSVAQPLGSSSFISTSPEGVDSELDGGDRISPSAPAKNLQLKNCAMIEIANHSPIYLSSEERHLALRQAPIASHILKSGMLYLLGTDLTTWRLRQFTAMNKKHNYRVAFSTEGDKMKVRGQISLCGYYVELFTQKDVEQYSPKQDDGQCATQGEFGIKLVPYDPRKRLWIVCCISKEDQNVWHEIFKIAASKSVPPPSLGAPSSPPAVVSADTSDAADATDTANSQSASLISGIELDNYNLICVFNIAYRRTRAIYGKFDLFPMKGTVVELVVNLLLQVVQNEIIDEYCYQFPDSEKDTKFKQATSVAIRIIEPIAEDMWTRKCLPVWRAKDVFQKDLLFIKRYMDVSLAVERSLTPRIKHIVTPILNDIGIRMLKPLIRAIHESLRLAYQEAIIGCNVILLAFIENIINDPSLNISEELRAVDNTVNYIGQGPLLKSRDILQRMMNENLSKISDVFESSQFSRMDVYFTFIDNIRSMIRNAIATFDYFINETVELDASLADGTTDRLTLTDYLKEAASAFDKQRDRAASKERNQSHSTYDDADNYKNAERIFSKSSSSSSVDHSPSLKRPESIDRTLLLKKILSLEVASASVDSRPKILITSEVIFDAKYVKLVLVELLNDIITKLTHDAILSSKASLLTVLFNVSFSNVQEFIIFPCNNIATSALRDLEDNNEILNEFNLYSICASISQSTIKESMNSNIENVYVKFKNSFKDLSNQIKNYNYSRLED